MSKRIILTAALLGALCCGSLAAGETISPRPRVILNPDTLASLRQRARSGDARYKALRAKAEAMLHSKTREYLPPGSGRSSWAQAAGVYSLLYLLEAEPTAKEAFAAEALVYMRALSDDLENVGDGAGGLAAIQADEGSNLATHAIALAAAYDWLYDWKGLTAEKKRHFVGRLIEWIDSYEGSGGREAGPKKDGPFWDHRFAGYFAAKAIVAAAVYEDSPRARIRHFPRAMRKLKREVLPALRENLAGGYPPDGWQLRAGLDRIVEAAMTLENASGEEFDRVFLREVVTAAIHSTKPDGLHIYDGGVWGGGAPGYPLPVALLARLSSFLEGSVEARYARFYITDFAVAEGANRLSDFDSLLFLDPQAPRTDFTTREPLSYLARGTGMVFFRSAWRRGALWGSFQSGAPRISEFQSNDYGHVTLNYLGSDLLIDAGVWREKLPGGASVANYSSATALHNTILFEPRAARPGGQTEGEATSTLAYVEGGDYMYARADLTGAYLTSERSQTSRRADLVEREVFFLRPTGLVIIDEIEPADSSQAPSLRFHFPRAASPTINERELTALVGNAAFKVISILPKQLKITLFKQLSGEKGAFTWGESITAAGGGRRRRFVTVLSVRQAGVDGKEAVDRVIEPFTISKNTLILRGLDRFVALSRADAPDADVLVTMPLLSVVDLYVTCLEPGALYSVDTRGGAKVTVRLRKNPRGSVRVSQSGILAVNLEFVGMVKERR